MCIYDRSDYACGHNEWGPMKAQCTRHWQKCCIRSCHDAFSHKKTSSCETCQSAELEACGITPLARGSADRAIGPIDTLNLALRLKPFPVAPDGFSTLHGWSHTSAQPKQANHEDIKAYLNHCIKRYQQTHRLPEDSVTISESDHEPASGPKPMSEVPDQKSHNHGALQDYQMQLMLNPGQQRKKTARMTQQNYRAAHTGQAHCTLDAVPQISEIPTSRLLDYNTQLHLLEQQNRKRLMAIKQAKGSPPPMDHETEQIMEMEGALGAQREEHDEKDDTGSTDEFEDWDTCMDVTTGD